MTDPHSEIPELYSVTSHHTTRTHRTHNEKDVSDLEHQYEIQRSRNESDIVVPEFTESEANVYEWAKDIVGNPVTKAKDYAISLFPVAKWILHYNYRWAYSDLVAGITVGVVLVPQSMSYAKLAGLSPEYGLYSSFVGVFIYSFFATSKDVSIGPVAVMSLQVGKVVAKVQESSGDRYTAPEIATFLSLICGGISAAIGILRLGFILEFISIPAVMGFMAGSAFSIVTGQVPALMGFNSKVNTRSSTYLVVIHTLQNLKHTTVDAAFGLVCLFILYAWKFGTDYGQKRLPKYKWWFFYFQQLRNAVVLIFATLISWGIVHPKLKAWDGPAADFKSPIKILGTVPSGLRHVGVMTIPDGIIGEMASEIPVSTIILLLEHIAIAKSFGRVNDYKIVPDQELVAIGVNNLIGTFFNAYPATGSFSRSALKAKCGVRTPLAGVFTGAVVLLALYALTSAFYYIPNAVLSAVIIHAVSDLIANYKVTWSFWRISPLDCGIFLVAVFITVFSSIENGIYFAMCASVAVLLFRIVMPEGQFLGRIQVAEVINPSISYADSISVNASSEDSNNSSDDVEIHQVLSNNSNYQSTGYTKKQSAGYASNVTTTKQLLSKNPNIRFHTRWVPMLKKSLNKGLNVQPPPPGVIVFKPVESFSYPNCSIQVDRVNDEVKRLTRRGKQYDFSAIGSRPWNDPGPLRWKIPFFKMKPVDENEPEDTRPILRIVHFDFSVVANIDVTSVQALVDLRKALNNYADREVEYHFSGILSPWIKRALVNAGFGTYGDSGIVSDKTYVNIATGNDPDLDSLESQYVAAVSTDTPFFHLDIPNYE